MTGSRLLREDLSPAKLDWIAAAATETTFPAGTLVFTEGDPADCVYFIRRGRVSVFIQKFTAQEELSVLGPGQCFGEMAVLGRHRRSASVKALTDATILRLPQKTFRSLCRIDRAFAHRIQAILTRRRDELALKENLIERTGIPGKHLHVSIKGDPSLRETAFVRERHQSIVDRVLLQLVPRLTDLLLNRCIYQVFIHFNSGEIAVNSVFDPFNGEIHPANKLADEGYIERHFPPVSYAQKTRMIRRLYGAIGRDTCFSRLSERFQRLFSDGHRGWQPLAPEQVGTAIARLPDLRRIPDFYLRNFMVSMTRDAIRMQFNCDGTHIIGADDYLHFLEDNVEGAGPIEVQRDKPTRSVKKTKPGWTRVRSAKSVEEVL